MMKQVLFVCIEMQQRCNYVFLLKLNIVSIKKPDSRKIAEVAGEICSDTGKWRDDSCRLTY